MTVDKIQRHIEFLERVHDDVLNHASGLYHGRSILREAVRRSVERGALCTLRVTLRPR